MDDDNDSADENDKEYAIKLAMAAEAAPRLARLTAAYGEGGALRAADALPRLHDEVLAPLQRHRQRFLVPLALAVLPAVAQVQATIRVMHAKLRASVPGGSAFQRSVFGAAARPPWPAAQGPPAPAAPPAHWTLQAAMDMWQREIGASLLLVYVYPAAIAQTGLVFGWQTANMDIVALVVLCQQRLPTAERGGPAKPQVFTAAELTDVQVQWPAGEAPEDRSDRGAVSVWNTPLTYVGAAFCDAQFALARVG